MEKERKKKEVLAGFGGVNFRSVRDQQKYSEPTDIFSELNKNNSNSNSKSVFGKERSSFVQYRESGKSVKRSIVA